MLSPTVLQREKENNSAATGIKDFFENVRFWPKMNRAIKSFQRKHYGMK